MTKIEVQPLRMDNIHDGQGYHAPDLMVRFDLGYAKAYDLKSWLDKHYPIEA